MTDYSIFYREPLDPDVEWTQKWDLFISAYNSSERVENTYNRAQARSKYWLAQPDYRYLSEDLPGGEVFQADAEDEADFIKQFFAAIGDGALEGKSVCVDITGFIKPYRVIVRSCGSGGRQIQA